jgi:hypothetical protein
MDEPAQDAKPDGKALKVLGTKLLERIKSSEKRESKWRKAAEEAEKIYAADESGNNDFNILHSNVETIVPSIYNSTPVPDIRTRRVETTGPEPQQPQEPQPDQTGQVPPEAVQQFQQQLMQFQQEAQAYAQKKQRDADAKLVATLLERSISVQIDDNRLDAEVEGSSQDAFVAGRGVVRVRFEADTEGEKVSGEKITFETVSWRDYREGPATRWDNVPWVAYRVVMSEETFERFSDKELLNSQESKEIEANDDDKGDIITWEVWDKVDKKVYFVREDDERIIKAIDDPLGLPGFFPQGQPVDPIRLTGKRIPVCPYEIYKKLAKQLDRLSKRIEKITSGMKVRGMVAGNATGLVDLSNAEDNEIKVVKDLEQLVQNGGLEKSIAWWPVEQAAKVLEYLDAQRDQTKAAIYEITGISDIVRGASNAGETATAQQIKTQWGSLRIKKMQLLIERQVRDIFVIMSHIIATKFSPETLQAMTGVALTPGAQQLLQQPVDMSYRVNVESDSTIKADLTRQKQDMSEFMTAAANYFTSAGAIIQQQPAAAEPLAEIFMASSRMFKLGKAAEDALERFVQMAKDIGKNPPPNPEQLKMQAEADAKKQDMALKQQELGVKQQAEQNKHDLATKQHEHTVETTKQQHMRELLGMAVQKSQSDKQIANESARMRMDNANSTRDHGLKMAQAGAEDGDGGVEIKAQKDLMKGLEMIAKALENIQQGQESIAATVAAPRKAEIHVDANGKKSAISVPMMN